VKVLIIGSGGREHALGWAILQDRPETDLLFCPGNAGTERVGRNISGSPVDLESMARLARDERIDLVVVGPEAPLTAGLVDRLEADGVAVFGPSARAAVIEGSKVFAKTLLRDHGIPTPEFQSFSEPSEAMAAATRGPFPVVIKADGLAAGKGVVVARDGPEAERAVRAMMEDRALGAAGERVLVESFVEGEEVSAFALARGEEFRLLPFSQDHKRLGEGDTGPNTGGMGAWAPFTSRDPGLRRVVADEIIAPTLAALARGGRPFHGLLYAGLMLVQGRPTVLEFNCRFGDPETQAVLPLLGKGLLAALHAVATGEGPIPELPLRTDGEAAVTVALVSGGYPGEYRSGLPIEGLANAEGMDGVTVFHAGTRRHGGRVVTAGGRVLGVTGCGAGLAEARRRAYEGVSMIGFAGMAFRRDIGHKALLAQGGRA
jgi:phosphoribosylamine---glycine ligase